MKQENIMKYLHIRHWDYWWSFYGLSDDRISGVEFSITDDKAGDQFFFHLDICTLPALDELIKSGEYMDEEDISQPYFIQQAEKLRQGTLEYFAGELFYKDFRPEMSVYNHLLQQGAGIRAVRSPEQAPYYADIFIREKRGLLPPLLTEWMERLSIPLFCQQFRFRMADIPSFHRAKNAFEEDYGLRACISAK